MKYTALNESVQRKFEYPNIGCGWNQMYEEIGYGIGMNMGMMGVMGMMGMGITRSMWVSLTN